jgi:hypothetical protein
MTARGLTLLTRPLHGFTSAVGAIRGGWLPPLVTSAVAASLLATGPMLTVVRASDGSGAEPAFMSAPLLATLAFIPAVTAWLLAGLGRPAAAAGLLGSLALLAIGRMVIDVQLLTDPWSAARPELLVPVGLAELTAGPAVPVLLLGHGLTLIAGVLALAAWRKAKADTGETMTPRDSASGQRTLVVALCAGTLAAAGLMITQFRSSDPYLAPSAAVDAPLPTLLGTLLVAGGAVLAACLAASAADADAARGGLAGAAVGVVVVVLPPLAAAATSDTLGVSAGPFVALGGAALLAGAALLTGRPSRPAGEQARTEGELRLPAVSLMHRVAGALAVAAGAAGLLGAATRQVSAAVLTGLAYPATVVMAPPVVYPARLLAPAGALLVVLGALLLIPRLATAARPALAVGWAAMPLAATATLDVTLTATQLDGVSAGPGVWPTALALLLAPAAGAAAAFAGGLERDEVDLTQRRIERSSVVLGGLAAVLAVPAFGVPLVTSRDYLPAGLWSRFSVASWGLLAAAAVVVAAGLLAPRSRPSRAVALLVGAAAVITVHVGAVPLIGGRGDAPESIAAGTWFALACGLALLGGAYVALRQVRGGQPGPSTLLNGLGTSGRPASRPGASRPSARRNRERSNPRGRRETGA